MLSFEDIKDKLRRVDTKIKKWQKDDFMFSVSLFLIFIGVILLVVGVLFLLLNSWKSRVKGPIDSVESVSQKPRVCIHTQARYQMIACPKCLSSFCHRCLYENGGKCLKCGFQILEFM